MTEHTPLPWSYRPCKHDDWGWIRGPVMEGEEIGELVATARRWITQDEMGAHRWAKTDPYAANALYIVKACNAFPDLVKALEAAREYLEGEEGFRPADRLRDEIAGLLGRVKGAPDHG